MQRFIDIKRDLEHLLQNLSSYDIELIVNELRKAKKVFFAGMGRSGLYLKAFAMRLMQMGFDCHVVGETTTPAIQHNDLLFISSKSAKSKSLTNYAKTAREQNARVILVSGSLDSTLSELSDTEIILQSDEKIDNSKLPLGSLFELATAMLFEVVVMELMKIKNETNKSMSARHANLE